MDVAPMINGSVALAFTAGMVATFNPCGFSLLPAYIAAFVAGDRVDERVDRRVLRAIGVAAAVSVGFVVVFASVGLIIDSIAGEVRRQLPWVTIVVGGLLVVAGAATVVGWKPRIIIRGPQFSTRTNSVPAMVGYGVTYAIASLSCTIGPFLAVTGTALSQSPIEGAATYISYALGMGVIILILGVTSALAHTTIANHMRRLSRIAPSLGGTLMVLAGGYAIWYGRWELAVYDGNLENDPIVDAMEKVRFWFVDLIGRIGPELLAVIVVLVVAGAVGAARLRRNSDSGAEDDTGSGAALELSGDV